MPQARGTVRGPNNTHHVVFYGLSTCIWCKRTRKLLEEQGVAFDYVYVDLLRGQEREEALTRVGRWNPAQSFPTVVVDDSKGVVGYQPDELSEALGL